MLIQLNPFPLLMNPLQVLGRTEPPQVDEGVCHQLHSIMPTLQVSKPQQQPLDSIGIFIYASSLMYECTTVIKHNIIDGYIM
jgi:hypothetical protein